MAKVLVIDDDPLFREIAQEMLTQVGHSVTLAGDGGEVADLPPEPAPDLAVVDMLMPERDGIETIGDLQGWLEYADQAHSILIIRQIEGPWDKVTATAEAESR